MIPAMPTLPLLQTPPTSDAWHQVKAPGGYEGWYFDLEDPTNKIRLLGHIGEGCHFKTTCKRQYYEYQKCPTKNPPPIPQNFPSIEFTILQANQLKATYRAQPAAPLQSSPTELNLHLDQSHLAARADSFQLKLHSKNPAITAELIFHSKGQAPAARFTVTPKFLASNHTWTTTPLCKIQGQLSLNNQQFSLTAQGCLEHRVGTAPLISTIKQGIKGRLFTQDQALIFHALQTHNPTAPEEARLFELTESAASSLAQSATATFARFRQVPTSITFQSHLNLHSPTQIHPTDQILYQTQTPTSQLILCERLV